MSRNWSVRAEYLYISISGLSASGTFPAPPGGSITEVTKVTDSVALFGFNYRF